MISKIDIQKVNKFENVDYKKLHIITDFDGTLTKQGSVTTFNSFTLIPELGEQFQEENKKLYEYYYPLEIDDQLDKNKKYSLMNSWWQDSIDLISRQNISQNILKQIAQFTPRDDLKIFLYQMYKNNIPVIIVSAGIGDLIQIFLDKIGCNFPNIKIVANYLNFENGLIRGFKNKTLIHGENKNESILPGDIKEILNSKPNTILFGDQLADMYLSTSLDTLKVGFLEASVQQRRNGFFGCFDIVCEDDTSYKELERNIRLKK